MQFFLVVLIALNVVVLCKTESEDDTVIETTQDNSIDNGTSVLDETSTSKRDQTAPPPLIATIAQPSDATHVTTNNKRPLSISHKYLPTIALLDKLNPSNLLSPLRDKMQQLSDALSLVHRPGNYGGADFSTHAHWAQTLKQKLSHPAAAIFGSAPIQHDYPFAYKFS